MMLDDSVIYAGLVSTVAPALISLLVAEDAPPRYKVVMTYGIYIIIAILVTILNESVITGDGPLDIGGLARLILINIGVVVALADSLYRSAYKKSGLTALLESRGAQAGGKSARTRRRRAVE